MRALVGSEGSTGAVNGAIREILAKLRAESGTSSRSSAAISVFISLLVVSIGWLASEGPRSRTWTDCCTVCGASARISVGWLLTATTTLAVFSSKPLASMVTR